MLFFAKIRAGRRCSCFDIEVAPDSLCRCCFVAGTLVRSETGYRPIESIQVGEKVLSSDGLFHEVTETFEHYFSGDLVGIRSSVSTNPLLVTPDHPFLTVRGTHSHVDGCGPKCDKYIANGDGDGSSRTPNVHQLPGGKWHARAQVGGSREEGRVVLGSFETQEEAIKAVKAYKEANHKPGHALDWDEAGNIAEKDWLVAKWPSETQDLEQIRIPAEYLKQSNRGKARLGPEVFSVDTDFLWMIGLYLAEGHADAREVCFSLHAEETDFQQRLLKYFRGLGYNPKLYRGPGLRAAIRIYSSNLADWFPVWLGAGSSNKAVPEELMRLPEEKTWALIRGVHDGDGSKRDNEIIQTSELLALQLSELLHRVGEQPLSRIHQSRILTPNGNKRKPAYCVSWAEDDIKNHNRRGRWVFKETEVLSRVRATARIPYVGKVYNLEVEGNHTYVVNGVVTHNCYGQGIVGGYNKHGTELFTIDVTHPNIRTVNVVPNYEFKEKPTPLALIEGTTFGFAEFTVPLGTNIGKHDAFLSITKTPANSSIDAFIKSPADQDFVAFTKAAFDQRLTNPSIDIRIEFRRPSGLTESPRFFCLHGRYQRITDLVLIANVPKTQRSQYLGDHGLTDNWESQHFYLDNTLKGVTTEDFVSTLDGQTRWKIFNVTPFDPEDQLLSWDVDTRLIHHYESYTFVPL